MTSFDPNMFLPLDQQAKLPRLTMNNRSHFVCMCGLWKKWYLMLVSMHEIYEVGGKHDGEAGHVHSPTHYTNKQ